MSESIIIVALAVCWAAYLSWYSLQRYKSSRQNSDGVSSFSQGLGILGNAKDIGEWSSIGVYNSSPLLPRGTRAAARRRRDVGTTLCLLCLTTLFAALAFGPLMWVVHVLVDIVTGSFAYFSMRRRSIVAEREMKVHMLYPDRMTDPSPLVDARSVVNG